MLLLFTARATHTPRFGRNTKHGGTCYVLAFRKSIAHVKSEP